MFLIKMTKYIFFIISIFCTLLSASNSEDFLSLNQVSKRTESVQKNLEKVTCLRKEFVKKIIPFLELDKEIFGDCIFDNCIKGFVEKTLLKESNFKLIGDVELPLKKNKNLKEKLNKSKNKNRLIDYIKKSEISSIKKFENKMEKAQLELDKQSSKIDLQEIIFSEYLTYYLENYGREKGILDTCIHTGCDGYLFKKAMKNIEKTTRKTWYSLSQKRPWFPIFIDIEMNADKMIKLLECSIYTQYPSIYFPQKKELEETDISELKNKKEEINNILFTIKATGYPPKNALKIMMKWLKTFGDEWIGNFFEIAKFVLNKK